MKINRQTGYWLTLFDSSDAFNTVKRGYALKEVAVCAPEPTPFVAKRYGEQPADFFYQFDSGERRCTPSDASVPQCEALGPALFCMPVGTRLAKV